ncbi:MAG: FixH family protein [Pseudomonadota bacterium]
MNNATTAGKPLTGRAVLIILVAFFGVVIGVNLVMMLFAIDTLPGTDVDSAYRASLAYEREIQAAHEQDTRHWRVEGHLARSAADSADVRITAHDSKGAPLTGLDFSARLERPADKRADRAIALTEVETGIYMGRAEGILAGQWNLVLEGDAGGKRVFRSRNRVMLAD